MKKQPTCCSCEQGMKNVIKKEVDQVEGYSKIDHENKGREVRAAFGEEKEEKKAKK